MATEHNARGVAHWRNALVALHGLPVHRAAAACVLRDDVIVRLTGQCLRSRFHLRSKTSISDIFTAPSPPTIKLNGLRQARVQYTPPTCRGKWHKADITIALTNVRFRG